MAIVITQDYAVTSDSCGSDTPLTTLRQKFVLGRSGNTTQGLMHAKHVFTASVNCIDKSSFNTH